jgi:hypothetical protein
MKAIGENVQIQYSYEPRNMYASNSGFFLDQRNLGGLNVIEDIHNNHKRALYEVKATIRDDQ